MKNSDKTKEQLLNKINELQTKIKELEKTKIDQKEIKKELILKSTAFESSIAANSISDSNGIIINANPAFLKIWDYDSMEEVIGKPISYFIKSEKEALGIVTALDETGEWEGEYTGLKKDSSTFIAYGLATVVQDDKGNNIGYYSAVIDVSDQQKARIEMDQAMNLMQHVIEHTNSAVAIHDKNLNYLYVSQNYLDQYKIKEKNIIGKHHYDLFPDLPQKWRDVHQRALAGEILNADDDPYEREDGSVDWTRWECRPWYESDGSVGGIIVYTEVITERKQAEKEIIKAKEITERYLDMAGNMFVSINREGNILLINQKGLEVLEYSLEELIGKNWFDTCIQSDSQEEMKKVFKKIFSGDLEKVEHYENDIITKSGRLKTISWYNSLIKDDAGKVTNLLSSGMDITERKAAEVALKESESDYHKLFDDSPVALLKDDMSELFSYFAELKEKDVEDFRKYFAEHPTELQVCTTKIKILNINKQYLKLHKAKNKKELMSNIFNTFTDISQNVFKETIIAIATGKIEFESESEIKTLTNEVKKIYLKVKIEGNNIDYTHGLLALFDITDRKEAEEDLIKRNEELELFNKMAVGREIKMIDLKKEINSLLEKTGKEPAYDIVE